MSIKTLRMSELKAGDILLYHGQSGLSDLIRLFDGTDYSHAAIFDGIHVVEAVGEGVVRRPLAASMDGAKHVDVFRFYKGTKKLGSTGLPSAPVLREIGQFAANPERYAYEQLLLLAVLATTRKVKVPLIGPVVRTLLDSAASLLMRLTAAGKQPVICSELVYRCYAQAGADYKIAIKGADKGVKVSSKAGAKKSTEESEIQETLTRLSDAMKAANMLRAPEEGKMSAKAVADFVTPGDLSKSPSLKLQGRLEGAKAKSSVMSASLSRGGRSPGRATEVPARQILTGDGSFAFVAYVDGRDIVVENAVCTWFGGTDDPMDNGETASGFSTALNPNFQGCALPMDGHLYPRRFDKCDGSPIPELPWRTVVQVENANDPTKVVQVPLIDIGPSKYARSRAAIDLTNPAFRALGGSERAGRLTVNFRIIDGGKHLQQEVVSASIRSSESSNSGGDETQDSGMSSRFSGGGRGQREERGGHGTSNPNHQPAIRQFIQSPYYSSRNGAAIRRIVLHYTQGSTAQGAINWFLNNPKSTSAHYIIDRNGYIYQMVRDSEAAHHCKGANRDSIGIEHVALTNQALTADQERSTIALIRWLMSAYSIPAENIEGHRWTPGYSGGVNGTNCPHSLFGREGNQADVRTWVNANLGG